MLQGKAANGIGVDINVTAETKALLEESMAWVLPDNRGHDRPERSVSEISEMILRKDNRAWREKRDASARRRRER